LATLRQLATREVIAGTVERVSFHNSDNGFCVLRVRARGQRDVITVVGHAAAISAGEFIHASGTWTNNHTHGVQFKAAFLKPSPPTALDAIERYLGSGMIRGIGTVYAKKLVGAFGDAVFDLIEHQPDKLREVTGIGRKRAAQIVAGWAEQRVVRGIMLFLHSHGIGTWHAVRIYKGYRNDALQVISENPYRLARDIRGIGFVTADRLAAKLGIEKTASVRVHAGISYALAEAADEGHCGLPLDELVPLTAKLIEVPDPLIEAAVSDEIAAGNVVTDTVDGRKCIFLARLHQAESAIADRLHTLGSGPLPWPTIDANEAIPCVEAQTGMTLAPSQQEAIRLALRSKVVVITGGPGVGKTTLVNAILQIVQARGVAVALCAPTGRAAKRLTETTEARLAPYIGRLKQIRKQAASGATKPTGWPATCWWSMRRAWWMCR
jgi:exodeoxyribonuclease V alpha subunit